MGMEWKKIGRTGNENGKIGNVKEKKGKGEEG